jgi:hypothetical protein
LLISGRETFIIPFPNLIYGIGGSPSPPVREKPYIIFYVRLFSFLEKSFANARFYYHFVESISYAKYTKKCGKAFLQFSQNYKNKKEIY